MFVNRVDAGRQLAAKLQRFRGDDVVVVGLPRGGVPVAEEVAKALHAPLDVIIVRKLGVPFQPELGMGAIGEDGVRVVNEEVMRLARVTDDELATVEQHERAELDRRAVRYRAGRPRLPLAGRSVIVVDDGIATGSTALAACQVARVEGARRVVLAVPVAPVGWMDRIDGAADECVSVETPEWFMGIGQFYRDFSQTSDDEVIECLERQAQAADTAAAGGPAGNDDRRARDEEVEVRAGTVTLRGHLTLPEDAAGIVVFAHGSGSSRHSPRNRYVASVLEDAGLGTLLFDLLTVDEESNRANVFDIELLGRRLADVTAWLRGELDGRALPIGYFGASTGAAAALRAAAEPAADIAAVVSRGGRPDLAGERLSGVTAPTLLIVGSRDEIVLGLNREAQLQLRCPSRLEIVPGATHLFEEPGTLQAAAALARDWFVAHFTAGMRSVA
jgi:putative phosphoribosyl transferase